MANASGPVPAVISAFIFLMFANGRRNRPHALRLADRLDALTLAGAGLYGPSWSYACPRAELVRWRRVVRRPGCCPVRVRPAGGGAGGPVAGDRAVDRSPGHRDRAGSVSYT